MQAGLCSEWHGHLALTDLRMIAKEPRHCADCFHSRTISGCSQGLPGSRKVRSLQPYEVRSKLVKAQTVAVLWRRCSYRNRCSSRNTCATVNKVKGQNHRPETNGKRRCERQLTDVSKYCVATSGYRCGLACARADSLGTGYWHHTMKQLDCIILDMAILELTLAYASRQSAIGLPRAVQAGRVAPCDLPSCIRPGISPSMYSPD